MPAGDLPPRSFSHNQQYFESQRGHHYTSSSSFSAMIWQLFLVMSSRIIKEVFVLFRPLADQFFSLFIIPLLLPYTVMSSYSASAMSSQRDVSHTWSGRSQLKRNPGDAMDRALSHALLLVTDLPTASPKYPFTRAVVEKILSENAYDEKPLLSINRAALGKAFRRTLQLLETALKRQKGSTGLGQLIERYALAKEFGSNEGNKPEKLAQELLWLVEKMGDCDGIDEVCWQWSKASLLASMSLSSCPRIQRSLVRLSAILCRAIGNNFVFVPKQVRFRLLLLWLPLFCRSSHGGDGPIFSSLEKRETEEALQNAIAPLPSADQELIFAAWLEEYSWSVSDWPNLQHSYGQWCQRARLQASPKPLLLTS